MESSPNSLKPPKPGGKGMSKKPMVIGLVVFLAMLLALMYSLSAQKKKTGQDEEKKPAVAAQPLAQGQGEAALALPPSAKTPAVAAAVQDETKPRKNLVVSINQPTGKEDPAEKRRQQLYLTALASPMLAKKSKEAGEQKKENPGRQSALLGSNITTSGQPERETSYDPAANIDKEGFFTRADTARDKDAGWLSRYTREAGRSLEVKTGTVIPAVMVTGINSDLPGVMVAQVSQNVYDTATGRHLLLPQGAKLYGMYDSRVIYGQERVLVAWNRVIFPDGSSVTLGAMPGADISGYAGFNDQVNNHYVRIFGSAFLMSIITGGVSYSVDSVSNNSSGNNNNGNTTTFQDAMASALAAQMGQVTLKLLEKNLSIAPTLEIRPGYQFNVICTKDVAFTEPYSDRFTGQTTGVGVNAGDSYGSAIRP
jgi:type IV secretion system protein VirB10